MVQVRTHFCVVTFVWMLLDGVQGDVQIYNRDADGQGPRNISVNIHGSNGGNICIDCQNQIQVEAGLDAEDPLSISDLQRYLGGSNSRIPSFFYMPQESKQIPNDIVLSSPSDSISESRESMSPIAFVSAHQMDDPSVTDLQKVDSDSLVAESKTDASQDLNPIVFHFPEPRSMTLKSDDTPKSSV